ncbi:MAG: cytochrome c [Candidatus Sungbacteria bacterium]|nr:cytochrome c [Candidatus Sungbacteria bacterium]
MALFIILPISFSLLLFGCSKNDPGGTPAGTPPSAPSNPSPSTEKGKGVFTANCEPCHGPNGKRSMPGMVKDAADLSSERIQKKSDAELKDIIRNGKKGSSVMIGRPWLPDEEVASLILYLRTLQ